MSGVEQTRKAREAIQHKIARRRERELSTLSRCLRGATSKEVGRWVGVSERTARVDLQFMLREGLVERTKHNRWRTR